MAKFCVLAKILHPTVNLLHKYICHICDIMKLCLLPLSKLNHHHYHHPNHHHHHPQSSLPSSLSWPVRDSGCLSDHQLPLSTQLPGLADQVLPNVKTQIMERVLLIEIRVVAMTMVDFRWQRQWQWQHHFHLWLLWENPDEEKFWARCWVLSVVLG